MAAALRNVTFSVLRIQRLALRNEIAKQSKSTTSGHSRSNEDDDTSNIKTPLVAMSSDEKTVICWHPEPDFPYEHTKPLPRKVEEIQEGDSVLKVQLLKQDLYRFRAKGPSNRDLANMFFTTKHPWYPRPQRKYRKPFPPRDREGI